jgi:hypothetical protein
MYINLKLRLKELLINNISALTSLTSLNIIQVKHTFMK